MPRLVYTAPRASLTSKRSGSVRWASRTRLPWAYFQRGATRRMDGTEAARVCLRDPWAGNPLNGHAAASSSASLTSTMAPLASVIRPPRRVAAGERHRPAGRGLPLTDAVDAAEVQPVRPLVLVRLAGFPHECLQAAFSSSRGKKRRVRHR